MAVYSRITMTDDESAARPTQKTPHGLEIPVPTREAFFGNMEKVALPPAKPDADDDIDQRA